MVDAKDVWADPDCAARWSADPSCRNPVREEHLDLLLSLIETLYRPGATMLDVGIGSGLVEAQLFERLPQARIVGLDGSEAMVALAKERLKRHAKRVQFLMDDLTTPLADVLPRAPYQIAFSVQTIHNVPDEAKVRTLERVFEALEPGGWFLLADRVAVGVEPLFPAYRVAWQRLNRLHGGAIDEGESFNEHVARVRASEDLPTSLAQHLRWLEALGFCAECLHQHANRALIVARKPSCECLSAKDPS